jgi:hypothetical protein
MNEILSVSPEGPALDSAQGALDIIGDAYGAGADLVVIPVERLAPAFFDLRTGLAGEILQKFQNYRLRLVILGDVTGQVSASNALRDLVREANRGRQVWFVADRAELADRLPDRA